MLVRICAALEYAVRPAHQCRGVGTVLVRSGMRLAERMCLDVFVHAMLRDVQLYRWLGFRAEREAIRGGRDGDSGSSENCLIYEQPGSTVGNI